MSVTVLWALSEKISPQPIAGLDLLVFFVLFCCLRLLKTMPCASKPLEKRENETRCKRNWMMASRQHFLHSWKLTEKIKDPFFLTLLERKKRWMAIVLHLEKETRARTGARTPLGRKSVEEWRKRIPCLFPCYHRIMSQRVNTLFLLVRTFICPSVIISFWAVVFEPLGFYRARSGKGVTWAFKVRSSGP